MPSLSGTRHPPFDFGIIDKIEFGVAVERAERAEDGALALCSASKT